MEEVKIVNNSKKELIFRILLILIIVFLLLKNCSLIKKIDEESKRKPTGNIDIFNIQCEDIKCQKIECEGNQCDDKKATNTEGRLEISDSNIIWKETNTLRIFENPYYEMKEKIAPESSNSYQFMIKNSTNYSIKYRIYFTEDNPYNIHMKYKLRQGGVYVTGDPDEWVSCDEINNIVAELGSDLTYNYILDWKWESGDKDIEAEGKEDAYRLRLEIQAEIADE